MTIKTHIKSGFIYDPFGRIVPPKSRFLLPIVSVMAILALGCGSLEDSAQDSDSSFDSTVDSIDTTYEAPEKECCKYCGDNSKACGDTCIANDRRCHTTGGCACEG